MPSTTPFRWVLSVGLLCGAIASAATAQDPWPHWQRTANRLGNTETIGPRTSTIQWSAPFTTEPDVTLQWGALVIDRHGHLIAGSSQGVAVLDPVTHKMLWEQINGTRSGGQRLLRIRS